MSIRRFASNRPTLQRKVHMPPAPTFASPSPTQLSFASPLPLSPFQFPYSKTRSSDASPVTPIAQIMPTTPLFPPPMVTTLASLSKYMPRDSPPVGLCPANHTPDYLSHSPVLGLYGARCTSPIFPLGMPSAVLLGMPSPLCLDDPLSPQLPSPPEAIPDACTTPATLPSSITSCPQPQEAILRARPRPPLRLSLPRRLSYNRTGSTSPPSATTPRRASHELASPAVIGSHSSPAPLHKGLRRVQNLGTPNTSLAHAHQPRMAELGSYF
ncbi:hypothetical protein C8Q72DRAFT_883425 [Fomitopsis betulina]|nr:hypothetical protein C8Q72DRAFT_883425 [Fomitopsis betulina]